ncbi:MAG: hypothetical protein H6577_07835 [Lewinellaceae bacterium]|nr:hypothetical protein [Saprospiraceae bacterium]MCB9338024.1 hypothetical protein [Lewinellaceae bacterium]
MKDVWDFIKGLFQKEEESSSSNPYLHEQIERTEEEKNAYEIWKGSLTHRRMMDWLNDQYAIWQALPDDIDPAIDFLDMPSSKGFAIHLYKTEYRKTDAIHLFDYLKEQVQRLNYKSQMSDTRTWSQKSWVETVERHYLKPRTFFEAEKLINQRFGNITIELSFRNDRPHHLKFRATGYSDRLYAETADFNDLMQAVLVS